MTRDKVEQIRSYLFVVFITLTIVTMIVLTGIKLHQINEETCMSRPSLFDVEEDLESVFMTTDLEVLYMDDYDYGYATYVVSANGFYYKVLYNCKFRDSVGPDFRKRWKMERYVQISQEEIHQYENKKA